VIPNLTRKGKRCGSSLLGATENAQRKELGIRKLKPRGETLRTQMKSIERRRRKLRRIVFATNNFEFAREGLGGGEGVGGRRAAGPVKKVWIRRMGKRRKEVSSVWETPGRQRG